MKQKIDSLHFRIIPFAIIVLGLSFSCSPQTNNEDNERESFKTILPARENARLIEQWLRLKKENFIAD